MPSAGMSSSWGRVRLTPDGGKAGAHIGQIPGQCYPPMGGARSSGSKLLKPDVRSESVRLQLWYEA